MTDSDRLKFRETTGRIGHGKRIHRLHMEIHGKALAWTSCYTGGENYTEVAAPVDCKSCLAEEKRVAERKRKAEQVKKKVLEWREWQAG